MNRQKFPSLPVLGPMLILFSISAIAQQKGYKLLDKETFLEMETLDSPSISPDGKLIVFTRGWIDKANDVSVSNLWITDVQGARVREFTRGNWHDRSPAWSPDSRKVAFLSDRDGTTQIHVMWIDTGDVVQLTHLDRAPGNLRWSPDGKMIAYTSLVLDTKPILPVEMPRFPSGAKLASPALIIDRLQWRFDGQGNIPKGYNHVFVVDAELGGTPRQITSGDYSHNDPQWSADGTKILLSAIRKPDAEYLNGDSEIYAVDIRTLEVRTLTDRKGPDQGPRVSPDGKWVVYTINQIYPDAQVSDAYIMDAGGGNRRLLVGGLLDSPSNITWAPDNSGIYFLVREKGVANFWFCPISGRPQKLTEGNHELSGLSIAENSQVATTVTDYYRPPRLVTFNAKSPKQFTELVDVNRDVLADVKLGEHEELWFKAPDGLELQGWLIKPAEFRPEKKYPLMLYIHGGPYSMYSVGFNWSWQNFAANGYAVLYMNPRGSTGYGQEFLKKVWYAFPGKDFDDLMAGVDAAIAKGFIDTDNLNVAGGSAGGILTAWLVTHTKRFRAAVSARPMAINWASFVGNSDVLHWYRWFEKYPWQDVAGYAARSPLTYVENVTTPTLLMTGELDLRCPIEQTEEFYRALKLLKKDTLMIRMPDEYHGWRRPSHQLLQQLYTMAWFEKYRLKN